MTTASEVKTEQVKIAVKVGFFSGMLKNFQNVVFRDLKAAGFSAQVSHKIALDYASQLGNAMANDETIRHKVSKANKDGIAKLSGAFYGKFIMHNSMAIIRIVQAVSELRVEGLLQSYTVNTDDLVLRLQEYLADCQTWVDEQTWEVKK